MTSRALQPVPLSSALVDEDPAGSRASLPGWLASVLAGEWAVAAVHFAAGPQTWVAGLGMLPGPIVRMELVMAPPTVLLVDARRAREAPTWEPANGSTRVGFISLWQAEELLRQTEQARLDGIEQELDELLADEADPLPGADPEHEGVITTRQTAELLGISRGRLDRMVAEAPKDLPGAPGLLMTGKKRSWRWQADMAWTWFRAYSAWKAEVGEARPVARPRKNKRAAAPRPRQDGPVDWTAVGRGDHQRDR